MYNYLTRLTSVDVPFFISYVCNYYYCCCCYYYRNKLPTCTNQRMITVGTSTIDGNFQMLSNFTSGIEYYYNVNEGSCELYGCNLWQVLCHFFYLFVFAVYNSHEVFSTSTVQTLTKLSVGCGILIVLASRSTNCEIHKRKMHNYIIYININIYSIPTFSNCFDNICSGLVLWVYQCPRAPHYRKDWT